MGSDFGNYVSTVLGWSSSQGFYYYEKYTEWKEYTVTDDDGNTYTVTGPDLEQVIDDSVKFSGDIDLDEDGETQDDGDEYDQVTVSYDSSDKAYRIGPFMLDYVYYYEYQYGGITHVERRNW